MSMQRNSQLQPPPRHAGFENGEVRGPIRRAKDEVASLGVLLRQLGNDLTGLMRDEITLAKLEFRREAHGLGSDLAQAGIAIGLAVLAAQALLAFLIIGLGLLIDSYLGAALIIGILLLVAAAILGRSAIQNLRQRSPIPEAALEELSTDVRWAKQEAQQFKREVTR
jgi:uncharacterized membrane protein YqjE